MLTIADRDTIRHAIWKRLVAEPGVDIRKFEDIVIRLRKDKRAVEIALRIWVRPIPGFETGTVLKLSSGITAPLQFEHSRLLNEIDEVAEQIKATRREHLGISSSVLKPSVQMAGNG